jgi:serine/threonine-protein kinase
VGAVLIGKWITSGGGAGNDKVATPDFVGLTVVDAQKQATNSDLKVSITQQPCEDQPAKKVCSQNPAPKTEVAKGETIALVVSTGAPKLPVPDVQGLSFEKAKAQLEEKGFEVEKKTEESDQTPGVVIDQDPKGDTEREKGSTITLTVAVAPATTTVPDVTNGLSCDDAKARMSANDLVGTCVETQVTSQDQDGKVIGTDPAPGTEVKKGSEVQIKVGKFQQQQTPVPTVRNQQLKDARKALQDAGFNNINVVGSQDDKAIVINQDPQGGTPADPASQTVTLTTVDFGGGGGNNNGDNSGGLFG